MTLSQSALDTIARLDQENKERNALIAHLKFLHPSLERRGGARAGSGRKKKYVSPEEQKEVKKRRARNAAQKKRLNALLAAQLALEESVPMPDIISVTHASLVNPPELVI